MDTEIANASFVVDDMWTQNSKFRRDKSLKLLSKIYKNINNDPNNPKFRRINISKIMSKPDIIPQLRQILLISGFKPNKNGIHIDLNDTNLNRCISIGDMIQQRINDEINTFEKQREKIKKDTKEKQLKYLQKSNQKKNELMNKIQNEKKDIKTEKQLGFRTIQHKNIVNSIPTSTKTLIHNVPEYKQDRMNKSNFVKDPEIMDKWYHSIIEFWWRFSEIYAKKDININRMIILFTMDAYRLILTKDKEYYDNMIRRHNRYNMNATNNRDISMKIYKRKQMDDWEREQLYNGLQNGIYKTEEKYNETRLPIPVSGINFNKEYVVLISNKSIGAQLMKGYTMESNAKCIVFTVYVDMVSMMMRGNDDNNHMLRMRRYGNQQYNNLWCVGIPTLFKFDKIGIKTIVKRYKKNEESDMNNDDDDDDDDIDDIDDDDIDDIDDDYDDPMNDHMIGNMINIVDDHNYNRYDEDVRPPTTETIENIIYLDVKSGDDETSTK